MTDITQVEGFGQQTRLSDIQPTDIVPWERGGPAAPYPASVAVSTLIAYIKSAIAKGSVITFGSDRTTVATPVAGDVFFDTDDGIIYQYELGGWAAKLDFVTSAEMASAIAGLLTQAAADARYVQSSALNESVDDRVAALLVAGANVTLTYNDPSNTLTIASSVPDETIDDRVAALLVAGSNISLIYNDSANTLTIASTASGSGHIIEVNGTAQTQRSKLNLVVTGATTTDDVSGDRTVVNIPASGGGATGLQYTYSTTAGAGVISAASLSTATTLTLGSPDAQSGTVNDVLARLKSGAIIEVAKDSSNRVRYAVTADYASGSVAVSVAAVYGTIASGSIVYLSIVSDAPSGVSGGELRAGAISAAAEVGSIVLSQLSPPSGSSLPPYTKTFLRQTTSNVLPTTATQISGSTLPLTDSGLTSGQEYFYRMIVTDALGNKAASNEVSAVPSGQRSDTIALTNALTATGYTPLGAEITAYNTFFDATNNLRSAVQVEYGFLGVASAPAIINWKSPGTNNAVIVSGSPSYSTTGAILSAGYLGSPYYGDFSSNRNSFAFGVWLPQGMDANIDILGITGNVGNLYASSDNNALAINSQCVSDNVDGRNVATTARGFVASSRTGANATNQRNRGVKSTGSATSSSDTSIFQSGIKFGVGGRWAVGAGGVLGGGTSKPFGFVVIFNRGLSVSELDTYETALEALMSVLGR
jgi:hypothetical protein